MVSGGFGHGQSLPQVHHLALRRRGLDFGQIDQHAGLQHRAAIGQTGIGIKDGLDDPAVRP